MRKHKNMDRQTAIKILIEESCYECSGGGIEHCGCNTCPLQEAVNTAIESLKELEIIHCKDCKYFELNHWETVMDIPLIVSHCICKRWGQNMNEMTQVDENGYCFLAEKKED